MASGGTPFVTNPLGSQLTVGSPLKSIGPLAAPAKRTSSMELIQQIKQLEIEGQKLRNSNLASLGKFTVCMTRLDMSGAWLLPFKFSIHCLKSFALALY